MIKLATVLLLSGKVFTMCAGGPVPVGCCNPPDRMDVVYPPGQPTQEMILDCDNSGGEMIWNPENNLSTCEGIDY